jgi:EAL domain-containing protein (putative c-di-GMP-specific phosphodiesterase class I)
MLAIDDVALDASTITQQLHLAIEQDEFGLYCQPLIDVRDRSVYGAEALIRWNHPASHSLSRLAK